MSYFVQPTVTIVLNPDDDPAKQNSVVLRKWTGEERTRVQSALMGRVNISATAGLDGGRPDLLMDAARLPIETVKVCVVSWTGPDFDGRLATPENIALLPADILDQLATACAQLNQGITEDEKKASALPMNGRLSTRSPGPSPDGTPATSPS